MSLLKYRSFRWSLVFALWMVLAAIATTMAWEFRRELGRETEWITVARAQFSFYLVWALVLTPITLWLSRRFPIERNNWASRTLLHLGGAISVALLDAAIRFPLHNWAYPRSPEPVDFMLFRSYVLGNGYNDVWMYSVLAFLSHSYYYYRQYTDRELRAVQLEAQLSRAQLDMLKMQLHPHFLFNTLHSISALMHRDVDTADRVITRLGELLRMTLENADVEKLPLKRELDFLQRYLDIEQTRFRDRLTVAYKIEPECLDAAVPTLLLQPLVENAIRHGIAPRSAPGHIEVQAQRVDGFLKLAVRDNGVGITNHEDVRASKGVGISNTLARLKSHYGDSFRFDVRTPSAGGTAVELLIPFSAEPNGTASRI